MIPTFSACLRAKVQRLACLPSRREQGGLGLEARHAAARLWLQLGCLHMKEQPAAADSDTPAASVQPGKAVHCFQQAALKCQAFGEQRATDPGR